MLLLFSPKRRKKFGGYITKMKKVVYSIKKVRNPDEKLSGLGFINDEGRCYASVFQKQASPIQEHLMKSNSIVTRYSEKKMSSKVT